MTRQPHQQIATDAADRVLKLNEENHKLLDSLSNKVLMDDETSKTLLALRQNFSAMDKAVLSLDRGEGHMVFSPAGQIIGKS